MEHSFQYIPDQKLFCGDGGDPDRLQKQKMDDGSICLRRLEIV
jgi:hypothetical protein